METEMHQDLISIINACSDDTKQEELEKIFSTHPYAREITEKTLKLTDLTIPQLELCIHTAVYLNVKDVDELIDEFVWKIGETSETFLKFFEDEKKFRYSRNVNPLAALAKTYKLREKEQMSIILYQELSKRFIGTFSCEKAHGRWNKPYRIPCAASAGNLRLLKYFREQGCDWDDACFFSARFGHLQCLKYAHENGCEWDHRIYTCCADGGHIDCFEYALKNNCPGDPKCRWICIMAAQQGHLELLKYAHSRGFPLHPLALHQAARAKHLNILEYICKHSEVTGRSIETSDLECLKFLRKQGMVWDEKTCEFAAERGSLECLQYAHENGCAWSYETCVNAASNGHFDCLKYAHENGCKWNEEVCECAAMSGRLECLMYAHSHGCPWIDTTCSSAALNGHLDCLQYAHENGCEWTEWTCILAAAGGYLDCLRYAHQHGCEWNHQVAAHALKNFESLLYICEQECEWDEDFCRSIAGHDPEFLKNFEYLQANNRNKTGRWSVVQNRKQRRRSKKLT